jgi:hypothetical protein
VVLGIELIPFIPRKIVFLGDKLIEMDKKGVFNYLPEANKIN